MAGVHAQGATFSFAGYRAIVSGISVETPTAEVTDMTPGWAPAGMHVAVPTGDWSGGAISVDYIHAGPSQVDVQSLVRRRGALVFSSTNFTVSRNAILESATTEARTGDIVRGTMRFRMTDYYGS